jgi:RNA 2',3'-cyclic 3'-phosphodiesterase
LEKLRITMKKTLRTFVAVEISNPIRAKTESLIADLDGTAALDGTTAEVKWVEPQNLHLTMKFLGEVHENELAQVCQAVGRGVANFEPFELELRGAGAFPTAERPRTVWLGAGDGLEAMVAMHDKIEAELAELGYREEHRRFQPHLTLGRVRGEGDGIVELGQRIVAKADFAAGRLLVGAVGVFSSALRREGPVYQRVGSLPLGG